MLAHGQVACRCSLASTASARPTPLLRFTSCLVLGLRHKLLQARVQRDLDELDGGGSGYASGSDEDARPVAPAVTPTAADICHAEEAGHVLKALAAAHPEVQTLLDARDVPLAHSSSGCCIC